MPLEYETLVKLFYISMEVTSEKHMVFFKTFLCKMSCFLI